MEGSELGARFGINDGGLEGCTVRYRDGRTVGLVEGGAEGGTVGYIDGFAEK